jgi:hypothetical protein
MNMSLCTLYVGVIHRNTYQRIIAHGEAILSFRVEVDLALSLCAMRLHVPSARRDDLDPFGLPERLSRPTVGNLLIFAQNRTRLSRS